MNTSSLVRERDIDGTDDEETAQLRHMVQEGKRYVQSFPWCPPIKEVFLGYGVGGVVAVLLFWFEQKVGGTDDWLWVVVGDLPYAYIVTDRASRPREALGVYCELMEGWVHAVREARDIDKEFPVAAPADEHHAAMLESRIKFIRQRLLLNMDR